MSYFYITIGFIPLISSIFPIYNCIQKLRAIHTVELLKKLRPVDINDLSNSHKLMFKSIMDDLSQNGIIKLENSYVIYTGCAYEINPDELGVYTSIEYPLLEKFIIHCILLHSKSLGRYIPIE